MLSVILICLSLIIFSFFNACFVLFLQFCFERGNIFEAWLPWVAKIIIKKKVRWKYNIITRKKDKYLRENEYLAACFETKYVFFYKILGGCSVCNGTWIGAATFWILFFTLPFGWFWIFPYIFVSGIFILLLEKHDNNSE